MKLKIVMFVLVLLLLLGCTTKEASMAQEPQQEDAQQDDAGVADVFSENTGIEPPAAPNQA